MCSPKTSCSNDDPADDDDEVDGDEGDDEGAFGWTEFNVLMLLNEF